MNDIYSPFGYTAKEIGPMFARAQEIPNVSLPQIFIDTIEGNP